MKFQRKPKNEILALRIALILAKQEAKKLKDTDDGGTCNLDLPVLILKQWHSSDINEAFKNTGLWASMDLKTVCICLPAKHKFFVERTNRKTKLKCRLLTSLMRKI